MKTANPLSLKTVTEGLNFRTVDDLKKMLQLLPIQAKSTRKAELVEAIANYLLGPKTLARARSATAGGCGRSSLSDGGPPPG